MDAVTSLNCTEIGLQQPWRCYDNSYVIDCCETCVDVRNTSLPVGEFHCQADYEHNIVVTKLTSFVNYL